MGKRGWLWGLLLTLVGGLAVLTWRAWPRERLLLDLATRVGSSADFSEWLSDHELLRYHGDTLHYPVVERYDITTGQSHAHPIPDNEVAENLRASAEASPDGKWILWQSPNDIGVAVTNVENGRCHTWPAEGDNYHYSDLWMPDSRQWLQLTTLPNGFLRVHDVNTPNKAVHLSFPHPEEVVFQDYVLTTNDRLLAVDREPGLRQTGVAIDNGVNITEYRLLPSIVRLRRLEVRLPIRKNEEIKDCQVSPTGDRIAWMIHKTYSPPFFDWLHRLIPSVAVRSSDVIGVWVSRLDGADLHEVGHVRVVGTDEENWPQDVVWLPGGRRLSFDYHNALWTVPVD